MDCVLCKTVPFIVIETSKYTLFFAKVHNSHKPQITASALRWDGRRRRRRVGCGMVEFTHEFDDDEEWCVRIGKRYSAGMGG